MRRGRARRLVEASGDPLRREDAVGTEHGQGTQGEGAEGRPPLRAADDFGGVWRGRGYSPRGLATISPKAQLSKTISMWRSLLLFGTLTATGTRPRPQQLPGNLVSAINAPVARSTTVISGDLPTGFQFLYSSFFEPKNQIAFGSNVSWPPFSW